MNEQSNKLQDNKTKRKTTKRQPKKKRRPIKDNKPSLNALLSEAQEKRLSLLELTCKEIQKQQQLDLSLIIDDFQKYQKQLKQLQHDLYKHWEVMKTIRKDTSYCLKKVRKLPNYSNLQPYRY